MNRLIELVFVRGSRLLETSSEKFRQTTSFRFRPGIAAFTGVTFVLLLNMYLTPRKELSDTDRVDLFLRERIALRQETERQFKKLQYQYLHSNRENNKYSEADLTQQEIDYLREEAVGRAKDIIRERLHYEEEKLDVLYGGFWTTIKRALTGQRVGSGSSRAAAGGGQRLDMVAVDDTDGGHAASSISGVDDDDDDGGNDDDDDGNVGGDSIDSSGAAVSEKE